MKKITKVCGNKRSFIILSDEDKLHVPNRMYYCKKCQGTSKEKIFLCHPETKK